MPPQSSNIPVQENFVSLSFTKEIADKIPFTSKSKGATVSYITKTVEFINEIKNEKGKTSFYIINYAEGGFVILSADNRTEPILGFSDDNNFNIDEKSYPIGLKSWMNYAKKQITDIQNSNIKQSEKEKLSWEKVILPKYKSKTENISSSMKKVPPIECYEHYETYTKGPLLHSKWDQLGGFNDALPYIVCNGSNFQVYAGCVPIAIGQVMKYYQYPTSYNWASMPFTSGTTTTANFIKDIHDAIRNLNYGNPIYDCDGTGVSSSANMGDVLKTQFNYSSANWANYNYNTVKGNLNSNRPVILSGDNGQTGHMWVCDGYQQTSYYYDDCTGGTFYPLFHMNWGWSGAYNGYFAYNNFNPGTTNYNNNIKMIYNITP